MLRRLSKTILLVMFIGVLIFSFTACDRFRGSRGFNVEVVIDGVETAEHYAAFRVINSYDETQVEWDESDFDDGILRAELTEFTGEVEVDLIIDDEIIDGEYNIVEPEGGTALVDADNSRAEFRIELEYDPELVGLKIDGPEKIYASQRQGEVAEYEYNAKLYDQYNNRYDSGVDWSIEGEPAGVLLDDNIIQVAWDVENDQFLIEATAATDADIYDVMSVEIDYLNDGLEEEYNEVFELLEAELDELNLDEVKDELALPELIKAESSGNEYEIIWSSDHDAIEIIDNQPVIADVEAEVAGYLEAFIQPAEKVEQAGDVEPDDDRRRIFEVVVINPVTVKANLSFNHNFPAARVDNFFELQGLEVQEFESQNLIERTSSLYKTRSQASADSLIDDNVRELIVKFSDRITLQNQANSMAQKGYNVLSRSSAMNSMLVEVPEGRDIAEFKAEIKELSDIEYVEENIRVELASVNHPDDSGYPYQWHYPQIRLPQAWTVETGSSGIDIAVLDTGVNTGHPDIGDHIDEDAGYNFVDNNYDFTDYNGHGTHVAGTIAANSGTDGVSGVMWRSNIIPLKVLDDSGSGGIYEIAEALLYASGNEGNYDREPLGQPVDIINLSLGAPRYSSYFEEAINNVLAEDIILVAAAGNDGQENLLYPAAFDGVISVGASDFNYPDEPGLAPYSNYREDLDIIAPGGNVSTDSNNNGFADGVLSPGINNGVYEYLFMEGTSMAAPHVSGVIGLMLSQGINRSGILDIIKNTSIELGSYPYEAGLINAYWAVNQVEAINVNLYHESDGFEKVNQDIVSLDSKAVEFEIRKAGRYKLEAVIDAQNTGGISPGDYAVSKYFDIEKLDGEVVNYQLELEEVVE